jgi:hypothetical protein
MFKVFVNNNNNNNSNSKELKFILVFNLLKLKFISIKISNSSYDFCSILYILIYDDLSVTYITTSPSYFDIIYVTSP